MFTTAAFAAATDPQVSGSDLVVQIVPWALILIVFYFLLLRPQTVKAKQQRTMLSGLQKGDEIVTAGGLIGKIQRVVNDNEVIVEFADNVRMRVVRSTITGLYVDGAVADKVVPIKNS